MQTCFLAPRMAEPRLSGATLLSVAGMSNSATAGGGDTDGTRGDTSGTAGPGGRVWLPSCRARWHPHRAGGDDSAGLLVSSDLQVGPRAPVRAVGSELEPTGIESGAVVTCAEEVPRQARSAADRGPAQHTGYVLHTFYWESYFELC